MRINPVVYENYANYSALYLGDVSCNQTNDMIIFLENKIPQYTHEDVLRFLIDKEFRYSIIVPFGTQFSAMIDLDKRWYRNYEKKINRKNWYRKTVNIVSRLIELPDPKPLEPGSVEMEIYQAVLNSEQYIIPVVYRLIDECNPKNHDVFYKDQLLRYFDTYGLKFTEFYFARLANCVPFIKVKFENYHTWEKSDIEIYLPYREMKRLYEKIYREEYPKKFRFGTYWKDYV